MRRAFTLIEFTATLAVVSVAGCLAAVATGFQPEPDDKKPDPGVSGDPEVIKAQKEKLALEQQLKDATHIRGLQQAFVMHAQNNKDRFPLPSLYDLKDNTVKLQGPEKDTTANIYSMLLYNGYIAPDMLVSPAESNDKIKACDTYEYDRPKKAANPPLALWDPGFSADFSDGNTGHASYAHLMPSKPRYPLWTSTFDATQPVLGNRGPKVAAVTYKGEPGARTATPEIHGKSKTFAIHATPDAWEGNIAFADGHVEFMTQLTHAKRTFKNDKDEAMPDVLFLNEDTDPADTNIILGIFTHAGPTTRNFKAIWD